METLPTLNSKNFKYVKCPNCEKYPERWNNYKVVAPRVGFTGLRWVAEEHRIELQGYCDCCYKEYRVRIDGISDHFLSQITLFNPKISEQVGPIEEHLRR